MMRQRRLLTRATASLAAMVLAVDVAVAQGVSETLVADLSSHLIAITPDFTGVDLLLFGTTDGTGDVVVVIRGPQNDVVMRRKERVAGVWVHTDSVAFKGVPGYYALAANQPLELLDAEAEFAFAQIGVENLRLDAVDAPTGTSHGTFRNALVESMRRKQLYPVEIEPVTFVGERLFRTSIRFPANVPTGAYSAEVYLIKDGQVVTAEITPLAVRKSGFGADVFLHAHRHPASYGAVAVVFALVAGWVASAPFRKV